jgi:hypothetical protein
MNRYRPGDAIDLMNLALIFLAGIVSMVGFEMFISHFFNHGRSNWFAAFCLSAPLWISVGKYLRSRHSNPN